ncbi:hypothetical protein EON68_05080, partial [archaeon]
MWSPTGAVSSADADAERGAQSNPTNALALLRYAAAARAARGRRAGDHDVDSGRTVSAGRLVPDAGAAAAAAQPPRRAARKLVLQGGRLAAAATGAASDASASDGDAYSDREGMRLVPPRAVQLSEPPTFPSHSAGRNNLPPATRTHSPLPRAT